MTHTFHPHHWKVGKKISCWVYFNNQYLQGVINKPPVQREEGFTIEAFFPTLRAPNNLGIYEVEWNPDEMRWEFQDGFASWDEPQNKIENQPIGFMIGLGKMRFEKDQDSDVIPILINGEEWMGLIPFMSDPEEAPCKGWCTIINMAPEEDEYTIAGLEADALHLCKIAAVAKYFDLPDHPVHIDKDFYWSEGDLNVQLSILWDHPLVKEYSEATKFED